MDKILKFFDCQIKQVTENEFEFTASDERIDRDGDILRVSGWDLTNFKANPVILYGHGHSNDNGLPIGRATKVYKDTSTETKSLKINIEFIPKEVYPFAGQIKDMVAGGWLKTGSVSFIPKETKDMDPAYYGEGYQGRLGREYIKSELVEFSIVPLPSNVGAVINGMKSFEQSAKDNKPAIDKWVSEQDEIEEILMQDKSVIPYKKHSLAPEGEEWDGPAEIAIVEPADLKVICTWYDSENPDIKSSYKLPHHKASGYATVWRGVAAAMGALLGARGGVQVGGDKQGCYNHLAKHYKDFEKEPPEFKEYSSKELIDMRESGIIIMADMDALDLWYELGYEDGLKDSQTLTEKSGRILSDKNKSSIKQAIQILQDLVALTESQTDNDTDNDDVTDDGKSINELLNQEVEIK